MPLPSGTCLSSASGYMPRLHAQQSGPLKTRWPGRPVESEAAIWLSRGEQRDQLLKH